MFWRQKKSFVERQVSYFLHEFEFWQSLRVSKHVLKTLRGKCVSLAKKKGKTNQTKTIMGDVLRLNERISAKLINTSSNKTIYHVKRPQDCG